MLFVTEELSLDEGLLKYDFVKASGPGGQNVNKVSTAVQLRFDLNQAVVLLPDAQQRLRKLAGSRMTDDGLLIIEAKRYRSQEKNKADATSRLVKLIQQALEAPTVRIPTKPGKTAKAARSSGKKRKSEIKKSRRYIPEDWE